MAMVLALTPKNKQLEQKIAEVDRLAEATPDRREHLNSYKGLLKLLLKSNKQIQRQVGFMAVVVAVEKPMSPGDEASLTGVMQQLSARTEERLAATDLMDAATRTWTLFEKTKYFLFYVGLGAVKFGVGGAVVGAVAAGVLGATLTPCIFGGIAVGVIMGGIIGWVSSPAEAGRHKAEMAKITTDNASLMKAICQFQRDCTDFFEPMCIG